MSLNKQTIKSIINQEIATTFGADFGTYAQSIIDDIVREELQKIIRRILYEQLLKMLSDSNLIVKLHDDCEIK